MDDLESNLINGKKNKKIGLLFNILLFSWIILSPLFWSLDFSNVSLSSYDIFGLAPRGSIHLIIFYILLILSIFINGLKFYHFVLLIFYYPLIQIINYPHMIIRDTYLHSAPVKYIIETGSIFNMDNIAASNWPLSYWIHAAFVSITGMDIILSSFILYLFLMVIEGFVIYRISKKIGESSYKISYYTGVVFISLFINHLLDNLHHYSRTTLSFVLLTIFYYLYLKESSFKNTILKIFIIIAIFITHPFQSTVIVVFLIANAILSKKDFKIAFVFTSIYIIQNIYLNNDTFNIGLYYLLHFDLIKYVTPLYVSLQTATNDLWWSVFLRNYFKYIMYAIIVITSIGSIIYIFFTKRKDNIINEGISIFSSSLVILIFLLILPDWHIGRFTAFIAYVSFFIFPILFYQNSIFRRIIPNRIIDNILSLKDKKIILLVIVFIISFSASVMTLRFERNYYYGELTSLPELSSFVYITEKINNSSIAFISWRSTIWYSYYNFDHNVKVNRIWYLDVDQLKSNSTKLYNAYNKIINISDYTFAGQRDILDIGVDNNNVLRNIYTKLYNESNLIYSNGKYFIYSNIK